MLRGLLRRATGMMDRLGFLPTKPKKGQTIKAKGRQPFRKPSPKRNVGLPKKRLRSKRPRTKWGIFK